MQGDETVKIMQILADLPVTHPDTFFSILQSMQKQPFFLQSKQKSDLCTSAVKNKTKDETE